jgi:hypothetical protein
MDAAIFKDIRIREGMSLQVRAEFFNFTNTPRFGRPNAAFGNKSFGTINSQINSARGGQFGIRFTF